MSKTIYCPHCKTEIEIPPGEIRPYIYHQCDDGCIGCIQNPSFGKFRKNKKTNYRTIIPRTFNGPQKKIW